MAAGTARGDMVWARVLEDGVFRFDASEAARAAAGPSLSFADPRRREAPRHGADTPAVVPACQVAAGGAQKVVIKVRHADARRGFGTLGGGDDECLVLVSFFCSYFLRLDRLSHLPYRRVAGCCRVGRLDGSLLADGESARNVDLLVPVSVWRCLMT